MNHFEYGFFSELEKIAEDSMAHKAGRAVGKVFKGVSSAADSAGQSVRDAAAATIRAKRRYDQSSAEDIGKGVGGAIGRGVKRVKDYFSSGGFSNNPRT